MERDATPFAIGSVAAGGVAAQTRVHTEHDRSDTDLAALGALVRAGNVLVLTGAGISTDSGIPDYRGRDGLRRVTPMTYGEFVASAAGRQRYWARSYVGWPRFRQAQPNAGHLAVADLQRRGLTRAVITQNVDRLHQKAGAHGVVDLHGTLARVRCLACAATYDRDDVQAWLRNTNPGFDHAAEGSVRPDGDVVLPANAIAGFQPPRCPACDRDLLKPDVVFFGESVPKPLVGRCFEQVDGCSGVLVLGSSLAVMSGYRFVRRACRLGLPVAIVTLGWSRGDADATIRLDAPLGPTLAELLAQI